MKRNVFLTLLSSISIAALTQGCTVWSDSADNVSALFAKSDKGWLALSDYDRGKHYVAVGDYGLAIDAFNAALAKDSKSIPAMNGLAIAYDRLGRPDVARSLLAKALELDPRSPSTLNNLAYLYVSHGEKDKAALYFERAKEALASATPTEMSTKLETVVDNNQALMSNQTGANTPMTTGAPVVAQQAADSQTVSVDIQSDGTGKMQQASTNPPSVSPALVGSVNGRIVGAEAVPQLVDSEIWNLQIGGAEPKLIPPAKEVAQAAPDMRAVAAPSLVSPVAAPETNTQTKTESIPIEAAMTPSAVEPAVQIQSGATKAIASPVGALAFQHQVTVRIANGTGRHNMAHRFQHYFSRMGVSVRHLVNAQSADCQQSTIYYSRGQEKMADELAHLLPISVRTVGLSNNYGVVELMLAPDLERFDSTLIQRRSS